MSRYIGYLVLLISLYASGVVSVSVECEEPECPLFDSIMMPVPDNCTQFIYCDNGVKIIESCQEGLHFNPSEFICDWPISAGCVLCDSGTTDLPTTTEESTTEDSTTEEPTTSDPATTDGTVTIEPQLCEIAACPSDLPLDQFLFLPVPWDCSLYVMCFNGNVFELSCTGDLIFNETLQGCVDPQGSECITCEVDTTTIEPEITTERPCEIEVCLDTQETPLYLAVPWDCTQKILCIRGQTFEQTCDSGLHFSPSEQNCVDPEDTICQVCEQIETTTEVEVTTETEVADCVLAPCYNIMEYHSITAVPWNCSQFVECYMGQRTTYECSNGEYFDSVTKTCNKENVNNCVACIQ